MAQGGGQCAQHSVVGTLGALGLCNLMVFGMILYSYLPTYLPTLQRIGVLGFYELSVLSLRLTNPH